MSKQAFIDQFSTPSPTGYGDRAHENGEFVLEMAENARKSRSRARKRQKRAHNKAASAAAPKAVNAVNDGRRRRNAVEPHTPTGVGRKAGG